ncbi:hypothetical protein [Pleomorphomonas diazotrophica]|uniref:hypothetical protein n=1 Tax=Pleomorphomonas diazotrophica TaxID=1166257 RepID=UPI00117EA7AD|nr:hypothetical protein [Pleomorphomonas diazotrophica]
MAKRGEPTASQDKAALSRWWGDAEDGTEQFARALEDYLLKGTALPAGPREAFRHFRAWLIGLYLTERRLGAAVSPEVGDVFDRLLAVELALVEARRAAGDVGPVSPDLREKRAAAEAEAEDRLTREMLRPVREAREKGYREELAAATAEAEGRINALPVYRATEWLTNRRWLEHPPIRLKQPDRKAAAPGKNIDEASALPTIRLSRPILVERYGEAVLAALPRGRFTAYAATGGVDPDEAAGLFGFSSGDEMIQAMALVPKREATIALEAKRLMVERRGDPLVDGTLPEKALAAIHGNRMAEWLAAELKALAGAAGEAQPVTAEGAADFARNALVDTPVRNAIDARHHLVAERRAGEEVARLAASGEDGEGPKKKICDARRRQLLNLALYAEALGIADELETAEEMVRRLDHPERPEVTRGVDGWPAIDAILDRFEFRRSGEPAPRNAVAAFVKAMTAAGRDNELALADVVLADGESKPYRELPIGRLKAVVASLENIEHAMGRNDALVDGRGRQSLGDAAKGIAAALARAKGGAGKRSVDLGRASDEVLREIDGRAEGPAFTALKAPVDAAVAALKARRQRAAEEMAALYVPYDAGERRAMAVRRFLPALGRSLSRWEMIAIALNAGNDAGFAGLIGQAGFASEVVTQILAALDGRDARFVQAVWDYLQGFRGDIAARERRATGETPRWPEARPVNVGGVALKGGFYPLAVKSDLAADVRAGRFAKAMTEEGEVEGGVGLDPTLLHAYVDRLLHDLELSEVVTNAGRLLRELSEAFTVNGRKDDLETLAGWLDGVAAGDLEPAAFLMHMASAEGGDPVSRQLAQDMAAAVIEAAGLPEAIKAVGDKDFAAGISGTFVPGIGDRVAERSTLMAGRRASAAKRGEAGQEDLAGWLIRRARWHFVDLPVWLVGYGQGLARFGKENKAVAEGDSWVRRLQAGMDGKAEAAVKTMIAAFFRAHPDAAGAAGDLARALGAAMLFAREKVVLAAARSCEGGFSIIGSAPAIRDAAPAPGEGALRAARWAAPAESQQSVADGKAVRSAMMAAALLMDAPPAVAIDHVFGATKQTPES